MNEENDYGFFYYFILCVILYFIVATMGACSLVPKPEVVVPPAPIIVPAPHVSFTLPWEKDHPERIPWSYKLFDEVTSNLKDLEKAKDIEKFCPKYGKLTTDQKIQVWSSLFVWLSYYESSWDPKSSSVDVGEKGDKNTYSIGLFSVSVVDQKNYGFKDINYTYEQLLTFDKNIELAVRLVVFQINKVGKIAIGPDRKWLYFATLHPGGYYDETDNIAAKVHSLGFCK